MGAITLHPFEHQPQPFDIHRWATAEELARYSSGSLDHDLILAENARIAFDTSVDFDAATNNNVLFLASSGMGKTRSGILPNLVNHLACNYVITDTKGELSRATARGFAADGYEVQRLDTIDLAQSAHYNPLAYIRTTDDIPVVIHMLLDAISPGRDLTTERFWPQSAEMCAQGLTGLLYELETINGALAPVAHCTQMRYLTIPNLCRLLDLVQAPTEGSQQHGGPLDQIIQALTTGCIPALRPGEQDVRFTPRPTCYGIQQYRAFMSGAERTVRSIVISLHSDLTRLKTPEMERILSRDDLHLDALDEGRRVLYLVMSDNDASNSFLGNLAFKQLLYLTLKKADTLPGGRLARPVQFVCDEFANLGRIDDFERAISIVRSRNMGFILCVQSLMQLDHVYGEKVRKLILENCHALVFMGSGMSVENATFMSELCGTTAVGSKEVGLERTPAAVVEQTLDPTSASLLPRRHCIVKIAGEKPFLTRKYDALEHPNAARFLDLEA